MARYDEDDDTDDLDIRRNARDIPNYLVQAILVTLFCCLPLGIVSIVNAAKVNGLVAGGRYAEAEEASNQAKKWAWIGFGIGLILAPLSVYLQVSQANRGFR